MGGPFNTGRAGPPSPSLFRKKRSTNLATMQLVRNILQSINDNEYTRSLNNIVLNSYSSRTRRIWADIYNQRGRSKFSSSPITGNCYSTHLFPLHKTYSENITWPVINARSSWRAKTYWMNWKRAERIVRSKNILMSVSSKNLITLSGQKVSQCQLSIVQPDWS